MAQPPPWLILPVTFSDSPPQGSVFLLLLLLLLYFNLTSIGDQRKKPEPEQNIPGRGWHHAVPDAGKEAELSYSLLLTSTPLGSSAPRYASRQNS